MADDKFFLSLRKKYFKEVNDEIIEVQNLLNVSYADAKDLLYLEKLSRINESFDKLYAKSVDLNNDLGTMLKKEIEDVRDSIEGVRTSIDYLDNND